MLQKSFVLASLIAGVSPLAAEPVKLPAGSTAFEAQHSLLCLKAVQKRYIYLARQAECRGDGHRWTVKPVNGGYRLEAGARCLESPNGVLAPTKVADCNSDPAQIWTFEAVSTAYDGTKWVQIKNNGYGKCLEVTKARKIKGSRTAVVDCDASRPQQRWRAIAPVGAGDVVAKPANAQWSVAFELGLVASSAALDPATMKLRLWSGFAPKLFGLGAQTYWTTFDWQTGSVGSLNIAKTGEIFCQGSALDANGRLVVAGGSAGGKTFVSAGSQPFKESAALKIARGYNSLTTLGNGRLFTFGGSFALGKPKGNLTDKKGEIWNGDSWTELSGLSTAAFQTRDWADSRRDQHMWLFATGGSRVFHAGPSSRMNWIDTSGSGDFKPAGARAGDGDAMNGNAVMYAPNKILTTGGSQHYMYTPSRSNAHVIDLSAGPDQSPKVRKISSMNHPRVYHNSVLLPDGNIAIVGGLTHAKVFEDQGSVMAAELFDAETEKFIPLPSMKTPRNYHSIAILLPDGRVFAAGGGQCGDTCKTNHTTAEILSPAYLFDERGNPAVRPSLAGTPGTASPGSEIRVRSDATEFALVRMSSVTHSVNTDQRRFLLKDREAPGDNIDVILTLPTANDGFIPGAYMLFGLNDAGTPSLAQTIIIN